MSHIIFDENLAKTLATSEWSDLDRQFRQLDPHDPHNREELLELVRELVDSSRAPAGDALLHMANGETTLVQLSANFRRDMNGQIADHPQLSLSVDLASDPRLLLWAGISDILELPLPDGFNELDAATVLTAVASYVDAVLVRSFTTFTSEKQSPRKPVKLTPLELEQLEAAGIHTLIPRTGVNRLLH